jgi:hypothetical protein
MLQIILIPSLWGCRDKFFFTLQGLSVLVKYGYDRRKNIKAAACAYW